MTTGKRPLFIGALIVLAAFSVFLWHTPSATVLPHIGQTFKSQSATLSNGLQVVVIPNPRIPVVTHMMWIKAGSAYEIPGKSGVAHFLEHLMFKGTKTQKPGSYSRTVSSLGGQDNAFTSRDYTAYYFTVSTDKLSDIMALEADRLKNLSPPPGDVLSERDVIREERRQRIDNDPLTPYTETLYHALFPNHPYGRPIIGWADEIAVMTWAEAKAYFDTWYAPNNAVLVMSGDITLPDAVKLAQTYYGSWHKRDLPTPPRYAIPALPGQIRIQASDPKLHVDTLAMMWRAPSYRQDYQSALALEVMVEMLDGGLSTRLYQDLVVKQKKAVSINLSYDGAARDDGVLSLTATPANGVTLDELESAIQAELTAIATQSIAPNTLDLAKKRLYQNSVFQRDSVSGPAMIIGAAISTGLTLDQIETWTDDVAKVQKKNVQGLLQRYFAVKSWTHTPPATVMIFAAAPKDTP